MLLSDLDQYLHDNNVMKITICLENGYWRCTLETAEKTLVGASGHTTLNAAIGSAILRLNGGAQ